MKFNLEVGGVHCGSCKILLAEALKDAGAKNILVQLDEKKQMAKISCDFAGKKEKLTAAIAEEGYDVKN